MKVFKVSCHSKCGSYFATYLQSVTVLAESKIEALENVKKYLKSTGDDFIRNVSISDVEELVLSSFGVIDFCYDSDY